MIRNLRRFRFLAPVAAVGVMCAIAPAVARADLDGYFCGNPGDRVTLVPPARCAHGILHRLTRVSGHESLPGPADVMCALGKESSGGGGVNVTPAVCIQPYYSGNADSYCASGYACVGYATIIHQQGPRADTFYGHLWAVW
jgi:hypothetical protein